MPFADTLNWLVPTSGESQSEVCASVRSLQLMKIDYISSEGIQQAEKAALERLRLAFNNAPFSQSWYGYAAFMMLDRIRRDREIDLILLTHDRLLVIELKNWNNGTITAMGDHWLLNGN